MTVCLKKNRKAPTKPTYTAPTAETLQHGVVEVRTALNRTVYAKRVGLHDRLYARGKLTDAEWSWACRYVREYEIAAGARLGAPEIEPSTTYCGPLIYNRQCAAAGFLRRAHERIAAQERLVLVASCVECATMVTVGQLMRLAQKPNETERSYANRISSRVETLCARAIGQASGVTKHPTQNTP